MDPTTLAAAATALLAPYVAKAGEKLAEKVGEKLPDQMGKLWAAIADKFKGKPAAEEAAKDLAANPKDEDNQAAFRKELRKVLEADTGFVAELEKLLKSTSGDIILNAGSGAAASHGGIAVGGNVGGSIIHGNGTTITTNVRQGGIDNSGSITIGEGDVTGEDKNS
ncbi:MAG: hypothetical protein HYZ49_06675 [Chloroflexi bacterium]|nr:hypothetical protein [Chloroflexota bacterium]